MNRYRFILHLLVVGAILLLTACGGAPAPAAEEAAPAEQAAAEATEAPAEEAAAEAAAPAEQAAGDLPAGAAEYPEAPALELGSATVQRQPISEIVTYMALPEYKEPEWVTTEYVETGKLPPVAERLPVEPQVILASGMPNGIGIYGDAWRDFSACPTAGWNNGAGVTSGWFGIEANSFNYQALVKTGPLFRADQDREPFPNLAKSWEWNEDGTQLTMYLIEGAKWSDGQPFTADDVMFTWEDLINDPQVVRFGPKGEGFALNGQPSTLEKVDDFTIRWTFAEPYPYQLLYDMDEGNFNVSPAHILKPLHPKYNTEMDYKEFENALPPDLLPAVTMGPWVPVEYKTDELLIMRRNPYFWKVDEEGNQLPYIDEVTYQKGPSGVGRTLCTLAGGCDHTNLENPASEFVEALKRASEPDAHFSINWGPENLGFALELNQSEVLGLQDDRDAAVRALFREDKFRQALSHAMDRDGIAQAIMPGPFVRAWAGGLFPGSPEFDRSSVVYYPYNVELAAQLLAEIGLEDTDGNGILNFPADGPGAGEDVILGMFTSQDANETNIIGDQLVAMFEKVGIKVNMRALTSQAGTEVNTSGEWDMRITRPDTYLLPFTRCTELGPVTPQTPGWNRDNASGERVLRDWEQELADLATAYCKERDMPTRKDLINQWNRIFTEHNYVIGTIISRKGLGLAKRFQNVPSGTPTYMYQWVEDVLLTEAVWTPADQQQEQVRPNTLPEYAPAP
jgi:peptide/nickel transport system substrate-binding protein